jgi:hypothetical protein
MYDVYGTLCATYEEACIVAGIETPDQLRDEEAWYAMLYEVESLRLPVPTQWCACTKEASSRAYKLATANVPDYGDFIPF